jgi:3-methylfumaryl-CoA hydratase
MNPQHWIGRSETIDDLISPAPFAALSAMLDRDPSRPAAGAELPPLWHWLYFLPLYRQSEIGPDGHPKRGGFLPPIELPRRMWAGGRLQFHESLRVGDAVKRTSTIESVVEKSGRSGALVFVTVRHELSADGALAITEHQDLVYRDAPKPGEAAPAPKAAPSEASWEKRWTPEEVLLFRYSALTFNGHRIHYDRRYAAEVEGYPGLVVHGPLIATLLTDLLRERMPQASLARFEFRAVRPLIDPHPFSVCGRADGQSVQLWARGHEGSIAMEATATVS